MNSKVGPDGQRFAWGEIVQVHSIGRYEIVEASPKTKDHFPVRNQFHVYVDGNDAHASAPTLEEALLVAIAYAFSGEAEASTAARYMAKIAGIAQ